MQQLNLVNHANYYSFKPGNGLKDIGIGAGV